MGIVWILSGTDIEMEIEGILSGTEMGIVWILSGTDIEMDSERLFVNFIGRPVFTGFLVW
jgi:hypothetical protein